MNSGRYRYYIFQFEEPKLGHLRSEAESVSSTRMNISSCVSWSRKIAAKDKDEERFRSQKLEPLQKSYRNWWQAFSSFSYTYVYMSSLNQFIVNFLAAGIVYGALCIVLMLQRDRESERGEGRDEGIVLKIVRKRRAEFLSLLRRNEIKAQILWVFSE